MRALAYATMAISNSLLWMSPMPLEPDLLRQWIKGAKAGDRACFEHIMTRHEALVLRVAQRLLLDREEARDAAQEVFSKLARTLPRFDEAKEFAPWIYRMTVNVCRDLQRRARREVALAADFDAPSGAADPEQTAAAAEQYRLLLAALGALTAREREAVVLRDLEGKTIEDVAAILGTREGTVRSQLSTGRVKLKNEMQARMRRPK